MNGEARQYLITFLATLKGDKAVTTGLQQMQSALNKEAKTAGVATKQTQSFDDVLMKAGKRALIVAPVWLALRSAMMLLIRTFTDMVKANLDLETGMARIRTVMQGTAQEIDASMSVIERKIRDTASKTSLSLKELSEAFYFLKTSNLSTIEAMSAFEPTVNAMIGTGVGAKEMARAIAGAFNTMGDTMDDNLTSVEKFTKIADILSYTFATQDVEMRELVQSYEKLAPFAQNLGDSFEDLITFLGFLNTHMLRAGRAGRLTARAVLQLTKNSQKLAQEFGITFDPSKPLSLLKMIEMLNGELDTTGRLSAENLNKLRKVFETRGLAPIGLSLRDFEGLSDALAKAKIEADGFAQKIADIRMDTVTAQMKRMQNNIANLGGEFFASAIGAGDVVESFKELNDLLDDARSYARALGDAFGWLAYNLAVLGIASDITKDKISQWKQVLASIMPAFIPFLNQTQEYNETQEEMRKSQLKLKSPVEFLEDQLKVEQDITNKRTENIGLLKKDENGKNKVLLNLKQQKEEETYIINLMKTMGAEQLDIARYKLDSLEILRAQMTDEEYALELQKRQNDVLEAQVKFREKIKDTISTAELDLMKTMGASELQILRHKRDQIEADRELVGESQTLINLAENRRQLQLAIAKETKDEKETVTDLAFKYSQANDEEKKMLERFFELRKLDPSDLADKWKMNMFDKDVITKYWNTFSQEGRDAIAEIIVDTNKLNIERKRKGGIYPFEVRRMEGEAPSPTIPADFEQKITQDIPQSFWATWLTQEEIALNKFAEDFRLASTGVPRKFVKPGFENFEERRKVQKQFSELGINISIENISVDVDPKKIAEEAGEQVKIKVQRILEEDTTLNKLSKNIRDKL